MMLTSLGVFPWEIQEDGPILLDEYKEGIYLEQGTHVLTVLIDSNPAFNMSSIAFEKIK